MYLPKGDQSLQDYLEDFLLNLCPVSTYKTVVLLGGGYSGRGGIVKTASIPCNAAVRDLKEKIELRATVFRNQLYYCGGRIMAQPRSAIRMMEETGWEFQVWMLKDGPIPWQRFKWYQFSCTMYIPLFNWRVTLNYLISLGKLVSESLAYSAWYLMYSYQICELLVFLLLL